MLLFKILGFLDILTIIAMFLLSYEILAWRTAIIFAAYLILKGFTFKGDFNSFIDMSIGVYIIIMPIFSIKFLTIIFAIYLGQKAIISFF